MASSGLLPVEAVDRGVDFVVGGDVLAALGVLNGGEGGAVSCWEREEDWGAS